MASEQRKWTPGPWEYGEDKRGAWRVFAGDHEIVRALSTHGQRRVGKAEREANARLIASAPDLYEALKDIAYAVGDMPDDDSTSSLTQPLKAARAALSRAGDA